MAQPEINEDSYVNIQAFMVNDLHLSGNELIVYAVIYGFSQDGNSWFSGSRGYLAKWCQTSEKSVTNNLKKLLGKGFLRKRKKVVHGCVFNDYQAVLPTSLRGKKVPPVREESSPATREESSPHTLVVDITSRDDSNPYIPYAEIIDHLNEKSGKRYRSTTRKTQSLIKARFNEGFTVEDFKRVIDVMCAKWQGDDKMDRFLRPETLFGPKFESYLNEEPPKRKTINELGYEYRAETWEKAGRPVTY